MGAWGYVVLWIYVHTGNTNTPPLLRGEGGCHWIEKGQRMKIGAKLNLDLIDLISKMRNHSPSARSVLLWRQSGRYLVISTCPQRATQSHSSWKILFFSILFNFQWFLRTSVYNRNSCPPCLPPLAAASAPSLVWGRAGSGRPGLASADYVQGRRELSTRGRVTERGLQHGRENLIRDKLTWRGGCTFHLPQAWAEIWGSLT